MLQNHASDPASQISQIYMLQTYQINPFVVSGHTEILSTGFEGTETSAGKMP